MTTIVLTCPMGHTHQYEFETGDLEARLLLGALAFQCRTCRLSWTARLEEQAVVRRSLAQPLGPDPRD